MRKFFENLKEKILGAVSKINDSYEFKPALSEIEDSPVSPLGRFTFWTIVFLIITTVLWLTLGKIDIVASARGIVIPDGEAKIIQPLETGAIEEILIKEGDFVKKGQILIKLDSSASDVKLHSVEKNLKQKPLYLHNYNDCTYLGSNKRRDYYFCKKPLDLSLGILIIRLSNRPDDYFSMPFSVLTEALKLGEIDKDSAFADCYLHYLKYMNSAF